jgi:predicted TIM-barrel enzyme
MKNRITKQWLLDHISKSDQCRDIAQFAYKRVWFTDPLWGEVASSMIATGAASGIQGRFWKIRTCECAERTIDSAIKSGVSEENIYKYACEVIGV